MPSKNRFALQFNTTRFEIRPLTKEDEEFYCALYTNEKILEHICAPFTYQQAINAFNITLKQMTKSTAKILAWVIIDKGTNQKIGFQALTWYERKEVAHEPLFKGNGHPEIGILLTENAQAKGYALEAMGALVQYAFKYMNIEYLHLIYLTSHKNTVKFLQKLNAQFDNKKQPKLPGWGYQYLTKDKWHLKSDSFTIANTNNKKHYQS